MNQIYVASVPQHNAIENTIRASSILNIRSSTADYLTIPLSADGIGPATSMAGDWRTAPSQRTAAAAVLAAFLAAGHLVIYDDTTLADAMSAERLQRIPGPVPNP